METRQTSPCVARKGHNKKIGRKRNHSLSAKTLAPKRSPLSGWHIHNQQRRVRRTSPFTVRARRQSTAGATAPARGRGSPIPRCARRCGLRPQHIRPTAGRRSRPPGWGARHESTCHIPTPVRGRSTERPWIRPAQARPHASPRRTPRKCKHLRGFRTERHGSRPRRWW